MKERERKPPSRSRRARELPAAAAGWQGENFILWSGTCSSSAREDWLWVVKDGLKKLLKSLRGSACFTGEFCEFYKIAVRTLAVGAKVPVKMIPLYWWSVYEALDTRVKISKVDGVNIPPSIGIFQFTKWECTLANRSFKNALSLFVFNPNFNWNKLNTAW